MAWNVTDKRKRIVENFLSLGLLQGANTLIPVLVIPFIVRALGVEMFGKVSFAQSIVQFFTIVINYGFDYSATKEIAVCRNDKGETSRTFWGVISAKFTLFVIATAAFFILSIGYFKIREDYLLYLSIFAINIGHVLFPTWLFQGMENMKSIAILNFIVKLIGMGLPVFLVTAPEDYLIYAAMPSAAYFAAGLFAFIYATRRYGISRPSAEEIRVKRDYELRKGLPIFLNTLFAALYTVANLTILGLFKENYDVGIYSGAYKIICAIMMVTSMPIHMAIFPSIAKEMEQSPQAGWRYYKRMVLYVLLFGIAVSLCTYIAAPWAVKILLGEQFMKSIPLLRLLSVIPALVIIASIFTVQGLYGLGFEKYAPYVGLCVGLSSISLNLLWIPQLGSYGAAYAWIVAQTMEILISGSIVIWNVKKRVNNRE